MQNNMETEKEIYQRLKAEKTKRIQQKELEKKQKIKKFILLIVTIFVWLIVYFLVNRGV